MRPLRPVLRKKSEDDIAPEDSEETDTHQRSEEKDSLKMRTEFWLDHVFASEEEVRAVLEEWDPKKEVTTEELRQEIRKWRRARVNEASEMETWLPPHKR